MIMQINCPICSCPLYSPQDIHGDSQQQRKKPLVGKLGAFILPIEQNLSLLAIVKLRSGRVYSLPSVIKVPRKILLLFYAVAISAFSLVLFPASPFSLGSVLVSAILVTLAFNCAIIYSKRTFKERKKGVVPRLVFEQQQLSQIAELETRTYQFHREIENHHTTIKQLQSLHQSMLTSATEVLLII